MSPKSVVSFTPSWYPWDANFYLFSSTADPLLAELECLPIDEIMRPDKSDGPNSHCCSCLLVWNSVKGYWERLYGSVIYSITKLLIGRECYWALLAPRVLELKVVPLLSRTLFSIHLHWDACVDQTPQTCWLERHSPSLRSNNVRHLEDTNTRHED